MPLRWFKRADPPARIDDDDWARALVSVPTAPLLPIDTQNRLRELSESFLREKTISGVRDFQVTTLMRATIAVQACLPILGLGLGAYRDFVEIVVYPAPFKVRRRQIDDAGVVHEDDQWLAGEAMEGGPVVLSWDDIDPEQCAAGANVVIHEFVHKLDMLDGDADGIPPLPAGQRKHWEALLIEAYEAFCDRLDAVEASIPASVDPESEAADPWYASLPLDPYAATDPAEFFAVCGEQYFLDPAALQHFHPEWYAAMRRFFRVSAEPAEPAGATPAG